MARFHKESFRCMYSHPHKLVIHIIYLCPLHMRSPSPGKCYQLIEFVKFLKKNPRAFEWPGADLPQSDGGGTPSGRGEVTGVPMNLRCQAKLSIGSAGGALPAGAYPPPPASCGGNTQNAPVSGCACYRPPVPEAIQAQGEAGRSQSVRHPSVFLLT